MGAAYGRFFERALFQFGHLFDRQVDPKTFEPLNFREQRDSWNRVWTFLDWNLDPYNDSLKKPEK